jgi:hypothetical protein
VDGRETKSNHIIEMQNVLGIEAARSMIASEIKYIMTAYGIAFISILWSRLEVVASTPILQNVHLMVIIGICGLPLALALRRRLPPLCGTSWAQILRSFLLRAGMITALFVAGRSCTPATSSSSASASGMHPIDVCVRCGRSYARLSCKGATGASSAGVCSAGALT